MYQLSLKIKTLTPVILAQSSGENIMATTEDFFTGSVVRGLLAEKYVRDRRLTTAEKDEGFYKLFLSGALCFGPAYYVLPGVGTVYPLPLSLTHDKKKEKVHDLALRQDAEAGFKGMNSFGYIDDGGRITQTRVKKSLELHMSRQGNEERIVGSSKDGQMYNYEALAAGQNFESIITGERDVLEQLAASFEDLCDGAIMYIGRSKHIQYGKCLAELGKVTVCNVPKIKGRVALKFLTDFLPLDECFSSAEQALAVIGDVLQEQGVAVKIGDIFSGIDERDGFVGVWGLKRPARRCLKAGTIAVLEKDNWTDEELIKVQDLGLRGCGERCIDGFGRFELYDVDLPKSFAEAGDKKDEPPKSFGKPFNKEVGDTVREILQERIREKLQNIGATDIEERIRNEGDRKLCNNHFCSRMEELCKTRQKFKEELREGSSADKTLNRLTDKNKISLKEILSGSKPAPYEKQWNEVVTEDMQKLANEVGVVLQKADDEKIFAIYWQWYWRMARKNNRKKGGEE